MRAGERTVEIFNRDRLRIATHSRRRQGKRYVTNPDHMPAHHRAYHEQQAFNKERYRRWPEKFDENTTALIVSMLDSATQEAQAYRSCMGGKYGAERLERAFHKAMSMSSPVYATVRNILKNGMNSADGAEPLPPLPDENIHGSA